MVSRNASNGDGCYARGILATTSECGQEGGVVVVEARAALLE